jgi:hypothetical protein
MYHARDRYSVIMLRKPAVQRLIIQGLKDRSRPSDIVHVPVLIRFLLPDVDIPRPPSPPPPLTAYTKVDLGVLAQARHQ